MLAAYHGHAELVRALIDAGAPVDAMNDKGQTPLAGAVFKGHLKTIEVLSGHGHADPRAGKPNAIDTAFIFKRQSDIFPLLGVTEADVSSEANALPRAPASFGY